MKAVILAGGKSSRMGEDKAQLRLNGVPLIQHVYKALKIQANEVMVSGHNDYGLGLPVIADSPVGPAGPVGAIYSVWMSLKDKKSEEGFFTIPVDAPNIPHDLCERLYGNISAVATATDGMHQTFAWWRLDDLTDIFNRLNLEASISLKHIATEMNARHVFWADETLFYNINTPDDLRRYMRLAGRGQP